MQNIQKFIAGCKTGSPESKLADAYNRAKSNFESIQASLVKCLRVETTSKGLVPVFAPDAGELITPFADVETHLKAVQSDIEAYLELTSGETSLDGLSEKLIRGRRTISNAKFEANAIRERAVRQNSSMNPLEAEHLEIVQQAFDKRDRILTEWEPVVADLHGRLSKANKILEKYAIN